MEFVLSAYISRHAASQAIVLQQIVHPVHEQLDTNRQIGDGVSDHLCLQQMSNPCTYALALRSCGNDRALPKGKLIHAQIKRMEQESIFLDNVVISMYGKCGSVQNAILVFDSMLNRNVFSWAQMITMYVQSWHMQAALLLLASIREVDMKPDNNICINVLKASSFLQSLPQVRLIHATIIIQGLELDIPLGNNVVNAYGKCNCLEDAINTFNGMLNRDVISWNTMLTVHTTFGHMKKAVELFHQMHFSGVEADEVTFTIILNACTSLGAFAEGRLVHGIILHSFESEEVVASALINMYAKYGSLVDSSTIFGKVKSHSLVILNAMISLYARHGYGSYVLQIYKGIHVQGLYPDKVTFLGTLSACVDLGDLGWGKLMHSHIMHGMLDSDIMLGNALINMYSKASSLADADRVFRTMCKHDSVTWYAIIAAHLHHGYFRETSQLFREMISKEVSPNDLTFSALLTACAKFDGLVDGKFVHSCIIRDGKLSNIIICNALMNMYGRCDDLESVLREFDRLAQRNTISWNTLIMCSINRALELFDQMRQEAVDPNDVTFVSIISACKNNVDLNRGKFIHALLIGIDFGYTSVLNTALISMYGECSTAESADQIFSNISARTTISWNAMLSTYVQHGCFEEAITSFRKMSSEHVISDKTTFSIILTVCAKLALLAEGKMIHSHIIVAQFNLDGVLGNSLINLYGKCLSFPDAAFMFYKISSSSTSWNILIEAYAQHGFYAKSLQLFKNMQKEEVEMDNLTFVAVLGACSNLSAITEGRLIHAYVIKTSVEMNVDIIKSSAEMNVAMALINMYGKCGSLKDACIVFDNMQVQDVVAWNAIITIHSQYGRGKDVLSLSEYMHSQGTSPNETTYVNVLLACAHECLKDQGCHYLVSFSTNSGVRPAMEHLGCIIFLLGKVGWLDEAEDLINGMQLQHDGVVWTELLSSCTMHGDLERGNFAVARILELGKENNVQPCIH